MTQIPDPPPPMERWDYKLAASHPIYAMLGIRAQALIMLGRHSTSPAFCPFLILVTCPFLLSLVTLGRALPIFIDLLVLFSSLSFSFYWLQLWFFFGGSDCSLGFLMYWLRLLVPGLCIVLTLCCNLPKQSSCSTLHICLICKTSLSRR